MTSREPKKGFWRKQASVCNGSDGSDGSAQHTTVSVPAAVTFGRPGWCQIVAVWRCLGVADTDHGVL
jgi:hypothetical protein